MSCISFAEWATPVPPPPRMNDGRTMSGYPTCSAISMASTSVVAKPESGTASPISSMASLNSWRFSATRIASTLAPMSSTPNRSSTPASWSSTARFSAVWPPSVGSSASGRSRSMTRVRLGASRGSTYVAAANSGSVMIVAGFEFTSTTRYPSDCSTLHACVPE